MDHTDESSLRPISESITKEKWTSEHVLSIRHWTSNMFSFRTTRDSAFRFTPGHYARLGITSLDGTLIWRPYSMVSSSNDDYLEFLVILVPGGAFSSALATLQLGQTIFVDKACYGFLTLDQLSPGRDLWLLASGTGLGPFISILRDPAVWQKFERLIVVHSVRKAAELAYRDEIGALASEESFTNKGTQLTYIPVVTREPDATALTVRIPQLLKEGRLEEAAGRVLSVEASRLMICGNPELARDLRKMLSERGFSTTRRGVLGQMAFEKYW